MRSHADAPMMLSSAEEMNTESQPYRCTMIGTNAVEATPARFPAVFITPAAAPACSPEMSVTVDQKVPSVESKRPTLNEMATAAMYALRDSAPRRRKKAEERKPAITTVHRPRRFPQSRARRSLRYPAV